jgi:hypothetical protein
MDDLQLAEFIDTARFQCRLRELSFFAPDSASDRSRRIAQSLMKLTPGRFLIGLGPNCGDVIRIGKHPVRIGRLASLLETPHEEVVDVMVNDAALHGPREVSRLHCTVTTDGCESDEIAIIDEGSSTGTWILENGSRASAQEPMHITSGTAFSLGPSFTNLFLFVAR